MQLFPGFPKVIHTMPIRLLIIAVEDYPQSTTTSQTLPGTISNAEKFIERMEKILSVKKEHITMCCSGDSRWRTDGTTKKDVKKAILRLLKSGSNNTERLFVFVTGHGVMKSGPGCEPHKNYLLCSDFESSSVSGDAVIDVSELRTLLSRCLGVGTHVHFVDACRTIDPVLVPGGLGVVCDSASSGVASWYQLFSASEGAYANTDSRFIDRVLSALDGECDLERDENQRGLYWVAFRKLTDAVRQDFEAQQRAVEICSVAEHSDVRIRSIEIAGPTPTIADTRGKKGPPLDLLRDYDDLILFGETNGQLPDFLKTAAEVRQQRPWKRIDVLSIEDLSSAGRPGVSIAVLEQERESMEKYVSENASKIADQVSLYRYAYADVGTYGSFWTKKTGQRHVHTSAKVVGMNIRLSPSSDFVDFPQSPHPTVEALFDIANSAIKQSRLVFTFTKSKDPT
jgi:hypothetical protein